VAISDESDRERPMHAVDYVLRLVNLDWKMRGHAESQRITGRSTWQQLCAAAHNRCGRNSRGLTWLTAAIRALRIVRHNYSEMLRPSREPDLFRPEGPDQRNVAYAQARQPLLPAPDVRPVPRPGRRT
jgi:hypothetical protein